MGLFDDIKCEFPLPDECKETNFQTKDFPDPYLDKYVITKEGKLAKRTFSGVGDEWHHDKDEPMEFHGILNFYTYTGSHEAGDFKWWEYAAKFTDGKLVSITRVDRDPFDEP